MTRSGGYFAFRTPLAIAAASTVPFLVGCGTIMNGSSELITINSNPPGATVSISGGGSVVTPASVEFDRGRSYVLTFRKEGYEAQTATIRSGISGWVFGNIIFGGVPGLIVDAITGGWSNLEPDQVNVHLVEEK